MIIAKKNRIFMQIKRNKEEAMNPPQKAAFLSDIKALGKNILSKENIGGLLLSARSSRDADAKKQIEIIRYLESKGADLNETDKNGVTPLRRAVRFRSPAAVRTLLKMGAKMDVQDKKSHSTALHRAATNTGTPKTKGKGHEIRALKVFKAAKFGFRK
jgi:ankyrin repeat protein